jgi:DNA-binding response OmpR family regulator
LAGRLKIFPVKYDPKKKGLVLAVVDPTEPQLMKELRSILPQVSKLTFSVASATEIERAIDAFYKGRKMTSAPILEVPEDFSILPNGKHAEQEFALEEKIGHPEKILLLEADRARARAIEALLHTEGYDHVTWTICPKDARNALEEINPDLLMVNGQAFRPEGPWMSDLENKTRIPPITFYEIAPFLLGQEYSYRQMSDALVNMVTFLVRKYLHNDPHRIKETVARVKLCKLVALRMKLSRSQLDGVILAAWLPEGGIGDEFLKQVTTPYRLHEIVSYDLADGACNRIETTVVDTVKKYQAFIRQYTEASGELNEIREALNPDTSDPGREAVIETLIRIVKEEEFLAGVDQVASERILVVDPQAAEDSPSLLRLSNEGFEIQIVKTAKEALKTISTMTVDLVISDLAFEDTNGLKLCRAIKGKPETKMIPFLFLTADEGEKLQVECLESGADDFLQKSADIEVLALKVQRLVSARQSNRPAGGVHGSLTEMNSADLIQSLSAGEKDVEIRLEYGGQKGKVYMQRGEIVHAETGDLSGDEAFYALVAWQQGDFNIVSCDTFPPRTIHGPLMSMLIEGARRVDEARDG